MIEGSSLLQDQSENKEARKTVLSKVIPLGSPANAASSKKTTVDDFIESSQEDDTWPEQRPSVLSPPPPLKRKSLLWNMNSPNFLVKDLAVKKVKEYEAPFLRTAVLAKRRASRNKAINDDLKVVAI
mmetsp:Transcript_1773/g.2301  ORF Transcript_1773/g.2301 Transcript_1773/m.2301 type:complete len:127 (-) Transcript_1773:399-779(-)